MEKKKYTIQDLSEGKCAVINDGTLDQLKEVLQKAFPNDSSTKYMTGLYKFYYQHYSMTLNHQWFGDSITTLPKVSVSEFIGGWVPQMGERVLVSDYKKDWVERIFIKENKDNKHHPYAVVVKADEETYERCGYNENGNVLLSNWKYIKPLPKESKPQDINFTLPERWCIKITEDNLQIVGDYYNRQGSTCYTNRDKIGVYYSSHNLDNGCSVMGTEDYGANFAMSFIWSGFTEITFEQFQKYVLKNQEKSMKDYTVTSIQAQEIFNIACKDWKQKLSTMWGAKIMMGENITITHEFYDEMRSACTASQHKLFDGIFGSVPKEIDFNKPSTFGNVEIYKKVGDTNNCLVSVRIAGEHAYKSLFLNPGYNWEIKTDSFGTKCLIPTKK